MGTLWKLSGGKYENNIKGLLQAKISYNGSSAHAVHGSIYIEAGSGNKSCQRQCVCLCHVMFECKKVTSGTCYDYKLRAYATINGKRVYSAYSDILTRGAVNKKPEYTTTVISRDKENLLIRLDSAKYNGALVLDGTSLSLCDSDNESDIQDSENTVKIASYSTDGTTYTNMGKKDTVALKGGESIYLKLVPTATTVDMTSGSILGTTEITYNTWPCILRLNLNGKGYATQNLEMIH